MAKVVGLSKLKTKYESHESKRQLCAAYDLFVADERIIPSLPKLLGAPLKMKFRQSEPTRQEGCISCLSCGLYLPCNVWHNCHAEPPLDSLQAWGTCESCAERAAARTPFQHVTSPLSWMPKHPSSSASEHSISFRAPISCAQARPSSRRRSSRCRWTCAARTGRPRSPPPAPPPTCSSQAEPASPSGTQPKPHQSHATGIQIRLWAGPQRLRISDDLWH